MVPALFFNSKPSLSKNSLSLTQGSIHLPVHPPMSPRVTAEIRCRKKDNTNWRLLEQACSQPANHSHCGEGLIPPPSSSNHQLN
ncbi:hypothetical protein CHARACLAT_026680 [Characodon lateralis]|uniref:Uncharacterized protein n=1 Tax=Characodon lateralis TaxID=208331 RepID=A0ABU7D4C3_9TELE|nr:hypothetical protein [Characodon lateralis]